MSVCAYKERRELIGWRRKVRLRGALEVLELTIKLPPTPDSGFGEELNEKREENEELEDLEDLERLSWAVIAAFVVCIVRDVGGSFGPPAFSMVMSASIRALFVRRSREDDTVYFPLIHAC